MPKIIEAIYEDGVFKPLEKVDLKDGEKVRVEIKKDIDRLRGKYKAKLPQMVELKDEIYDRRCHLHR
ncbi:MAG: antitoxin family protein [Archaeoglobaceae archaeon]|uniref:Antitoxin n=1 Tax=Archaeoglobus fulgidus TaxID=2234 RepID=A0A7J3M223_ARCFL|nr:antitoxin family protein [Archaeoglobales archaeon]